MNTMQVRAANAGGLWSLFAPMLVTLTSAGAPDPPVLTPGKDPDRHDPGVGNALRTNPFGLITELFISSDQHTGGGSLPSVPHPHRVTLHTNPFNTYTTIRHRNG